MASPPLTAFETAAFGELATLDVEAGVEEVCEPVLRPVVNVDERVRFELGDGVAKVVFALVDVVTTVTVDEGTEEVEVAVYDGPVESLIVVVDPPATDEVDPDPLTWNGCEYWVKVLFCSCSIKKP